MVILGKHTLNETRDLLAVADYRFKETGKAFDELKDKPVDLTNDWLPTLAKWNLARVDIVSELRKKAALGLTTPSDLIATEPEWLRVLGFVQGQELVKGSLQDVTNRIKQPPDQRHRLAIEDSLAVAPRDTDEIME